MAQTKQLYNVLTRETIEDACWTKTTFFAETLQEATKRLGGGFYSPTDIALDKSNSIIVDVVDEQQPST